MLRSLLFSCVLLATSGCAELRFSDTSSPPPKYALGFYETKPVAVVTIAGDCAVTFTVTSVPGEKRYVRFKPGYGSNKLGIEFENGMIKSVNQETDSKVPETITAAGSLLSSVTSLTKSSTAATKLVGEKTEETKTTTKTRVCKPAVRVFNLTDPKVMDQIKKFEVETDILE